MLGEVYLSTEDEYVFKNNERQKELFKKLDESEKQGLLKITFKNVGSYNEKYSISLTGK